MTDREGNPIRPHARLKNRRDGRSAVVKQIEAYEGMRIAVVVISMGDNKYRQIGITPEDFLHEECQ